MSARRTIPSRPFVWLLAFALIALALMSVTRIMGLREELTTQILRQQQGQLQDLVATWEEQLIGQLDEWLEDAAADPGRSDALQPMLRKRKAWVDSLYVWIPPPASHSRLKPTLIRATLIFPKVPPSEDTQDILRHPCLAGARAMTSASHPNPALMAAAYLTGCSEEPVEVRLVAATEAATLLARAGRFEEALDALDSTDLDLEIELKTGIRMGIAPFRLVVRRNQRAELLMALGKTEEALDLYYDTGAQITLLDAPQAHGLVQFVRWPIVHELRNHGRERQAGWLESLAERAERRIRAWQEVESRVLPRPVESASVDARFIYDQYSDTPFLLYYGILRGGEVGAALALDQPLLLEEFLKRVHRQREHLVVTDANGNWVAGTRTGGEVLAQIQFTRTLTHLRVGLREEAVADSMARYGNQWIVPLVVTLLCVLIGIAGILAESRAARRLNQLMERQREFTARVTHELKTPLAGIRVMAENLEVGAFRDRQHLAQMAGRIVSEADKLTERVDEILTFGKRRVLPAKVPFDPEEAVLEAIDEWGPRLAQFGVTLHADLDATAEVNGDQDAVRDAIACLLDNALKYRDERNPAPSVWLTLAEKGGFVLIDVADNGMGVPEKMRRSVFERFVRVEGPNRGKSGGHGLGLTQVSEIAAAHGGSVTCTDGIDGGARFTLRLPGMG